MHEIEWIDPPARQGRGESYDYADIAAQLKNAPKQWGLIFSGTGNQYVSMINKAGHAAFAPEGAFKATGRARGDGKYDIYARYVGES